MMHHSKRKTYMKFLPQRLGILAVILATNHFGCTSKKQNTLSLKSTPSTSKTCMGMSGSGYNWAAQMAWIAEILQHRADSVIGGSENLDIGCISGASSASAVIAVLASLINNKDLFPQGLEVENVSKPDAQLLARALRFMAIAADMANPEADVYFDTDGGRIRTRLHWWNGTFSSEKVLYYFGSRVLLASKLTNTDLAKLNRYLEPNIVKNNLLFPDLAAMAEGLKVGINTAAKASWPVDKGLDESHVLINQQEVIEKRVLEHSWAKLEAIYKVGGFQWKNHAKAIKAFTQNPHHPVRIALEQPIPNGFISSVYAQIEKTNNATTWGINNAENPPLARNQKILLVANARTVESMTNSQLLAKSFGDTTYQDKFVFAVGDSLLDFIRLSIKEPDLTPPALFTFGSTQTVSTGVGESLTDTDSYSIVAGISGPYIVENQTSGKPTLLKHLRVGTHAIGVVGGFVDSRIAVQILMHYRAGKDMGTTPQNIQVFRLGKKGLLSEFGQQKTKSYFSSTGKEMQEISHLESLANQEPTLISNLRVELEQNGGRLDYFPLTLNWEMRSYPENRGKLLKILSFLDTLAGIRLSARPASMVNQGILQLARTSNAFRMTVGSTPRYGMLFDRTYFDTDLYKKENQEQ